MFAEAAEPLRVLHVINHLKHGGAERLVIQLVRKMRDQGVDAQIFALDASDTPFMEIARKDQIPVRGKSRRSPYSFGAFRGMHRIVSSERWDIIHLHLFPTQLFGALLKIYARGTETGWILTEHNTSNGRRGMTWLNGEERLVYSAMDALVCISQETKTALIDALKFEPRCCYVIENGVDLERIRLDAQSIDSEAVPRSRPLLVSVGRLVPQKGYEFLVRALALLPDMDLAIIGEGPLRPKLLKLARECGVAERLQLLGARDDVYKILSKANLYVQPSIFEGFGIAAVEAMALGLPVLHSGCGGLASVVSNAGVAFESLDPAHIAKAIRTTLTSPHCMMRLSREAKNQALKFDISKVANRYVEVYTNTLIAKRQREIARTACD